LFLEGDLAVAKAVDVLFRDALSAAQDEFDKLDPTDQKRVHKWMPVSHRRLSLRRYKTSKAWLAAATKDLKPRAVDWDAILAFLQGLMPLIEQIIAMFSKT
jgi:hypothetical protein